MYEPQTKFQAFWEAFLPPFFSFLAVTTITSLFLVFISPVPSGLIYVHILFLIFLVGSCIADFLPEYKEKVNKLPDKKNVALPVEELNKAILLNPLDAQAYIARAEAYTRLTNYSGAKSDIETALHLAPDNGKAYFLRAKLQGGPQSIEDLNTAIRLDPSNVEAYFCRVGLLEMPSSNNLPKLLLVLEDYNRILEIDPNNLKGRLKRAYLLQELNKHGPALEDFLTAKEFGDRHKLRRHEYHSILARVEWLSKNVALIGVEVRVEAISAMRVMSASAPSDYPSPHLWISRDEDEIKNEYFRESSAEIRTYVLG